MSLQIGDMVNICLMQRLLKRACNLIFSLILIFNLLDCAWGKERKCLSISPNPIISSGPDKVPYRNHDKSCIDCGINSQKRSHSEICREVLCHSLSCACCIDKSSCPLMRKKTSEPVTWFAKQQCITPRTTDNIDNSRDSKVKNHIPLIIGFAVGGIMLAVVIAGVLLGRANRALSPSDSSVATTPVSMSYSEWISNYSTGGWGSKHVNTRVQESAGSLSDVEDSPGMAAVYSIIYGEGDLAKPENYTITENDSTVIEVDEGGGFGKSNQLAFYHPHNDVLSCLATPTRDEENMLALGWPNNDFYPYESVIQLKRNDSNYNDAESILSTSWRSHRDSCWSASASIRRSSAANDSIYSRRRDTWSDESNAGKPDSIFRYSFPARSYVSGDGASTHSGWIQVPKHFNINFANKKHVFVDVHRSMSYSHEDGRASGFWTPSDGSGTITEYGENDFEKTKSFITIKNNYICYESDTIPACLQDELFLYSLQYNANMRPRRSSI